jgi:hypothetical protein
MSDNRNSKLLKKTVAHQRVSKARQVNGHVHVISPATASEMQRTLRINKAQVANALQAFQAAGVKL